LTIFSQVQAGFYTHEVPNSHRPFTPLQFHSLFKLG